MTGTQTRKMDDLIVYDETEGAIAALADRYGQLEIKSLDDTDGYKKTRAARIDVKNRRVKVEKRRKELKADALAYGRKVDARAKELTGLLTAIETPLSEKEEWYTAEQARIAAEETERKAAALQTRLDALAAVGGTIPLVVVSAMDEEQFATALADATTSYELQQQAIADAEAAEAARIQAEQEARAAEEARLAEIRAEQERVAAEQAEQARLLAEAQAKIEAEKRAQEAREQAIKAEAERKEREERLAKEAAERAAREERERIEREAAAEAELVRLAELEAARQEALRPDREKIRAYATALLDLTVPTMATDEATELMDAARKSLLRVTTALTKGAERL